jgi:hypothetical protein
MVERCIRFLSAGVIAACAVITLEAGGWVVITVTDLPDYVVAGKPVTLTYAVRQHGVHLLGNLPGKVQARAGADVVLASAAASSETGYYAASLTLPHAGEWTVDVISGFGGQYSDSRISLKAIEGDRPVPTVPDAVRGARLFVAKGCVTCHVHSAVAAESIQVGPPLTARRYEAGYLTRFLKHPPQAGEPGMPGLKLEPGLGLMPDLKLADREIASLVTFINGEAPVSPQR